METGPQLRVSSDRLEQAGIKVRTPGHKMSDLSNMNLTLMYYASVERAYGVLNLTQSIQYK